MFAKLLPSSYKQRAKRQSAIQPASSDELRDPKVDGVEGSASSSSGGLSEERLTAMDERLLDDEGVAIPPWYEQVTFRALLVAAGLSVLFTVMVLKLAFTVGIIPSLNIAAGLLGFVGLRGLTLLLNRMPWSNLPFTKQENTVIQTAVVAGYSLAFSGGFSSFLLGMDYTTFLQGADAPDNVAANPDFNAIPDPLPPNVQQPSLGKFIGFMFLIGFMGIFVLVPLRKLMIIDFRLTYPSGTATGIMIKGLHTKSGAELAKRQVKSLAKWGAGSLCWSAFKWNFSGFGDSCGFDSFPSLGFKAYYWKWYFDFSATYVGIGLIVPISITYSLMVGAVLSYGIMWPSILTKQGDWFPNGKSYGEASSNIHGLYGYKVAVAVAFILGDGLFNLTRIILVTIFSLRRGKEAVAALPVSAVGVGQHVHAHPTERGNLTEYDHARLKHQGELTRHSGVAKLADIGHEEHSLSPGGVETQAGVTEANQTAVDPETLVDEKQLPETEQLRLRTLRDRVFMLGVVPNWLAILGYVVLAGVNIGVQPQLFSGVKAQYVVVAYVLAPFFAFCNAYGMGLTDWSLLTTYGKVMIFIIAGWAGQSNNGIIAGLAVATAMAVVVGSAADLMQDFKTGWLTFASPRAMFIAQLCGMAMACIIAPAIFWLYYQGFPLGQPDSAYPAPFAVIYRDMAVLAVQGTSTLPTNCLAIAGGAFFAALIINVIRVYLVPARVRPWIPVPMALGIPAYLGAYFVCDMALGAAILGVYRWVNKLEAKRFAPIIASALIAGDGIWTVVSAILALAGAVPPLCMTFTSGDQNTVTNNPSYPH